MKKKYLREIKRIIANHSLRNRSTGYFFKSKSAIFGIIRKLIKQNLVECKNIDGGFMFVCPTKKLLTTFGPIGIINKLVSDSGFKKELNME